MEVLTAQPGADLTSQVPHHLYGVVDPSEDFDAARYAELADKVIRDIRARGRIPVFVGGSGLYMQAVFGGLSGVPAPDPGIRSTVAGLSPSEALAKLTAEDSSAPAQIDVCNPRRVSRALEIVLQTGLPLAASRNRPHPVMHGICLGRERDELFRRIGLHVEHLLSGGAVEEVAGIAQVGSTASRAIGFGEIRAYLAGEISLADAGTRILVSTRRYAKRQLTWFRNQTSLYWVNLSDKHPSFDWIEEILRSAPLDR